MPEPDDRTLVAAWCRGDAAAYTRLVLRHEALLRRAVAVIAGSLARYDELLVDDIVQETCVRLLSALKKYRGDCEPASFIVSVARKAALDAVRGHKRQARKSEKAGLFALTEPDSAQDIAEDVAAGDEAKKLLALLQKLGEPDRSILYMRDAEGIEIAELCRIYGLPQGTIKSKLSRARDKLRALAGLEEALHEAR